MRRHARALASCQAPFHVMHGPVSRHTRTFASCTAPFHVIHGPLRHARPRPGISTAFLPVLVTKTPLIVTKIVFSANLSQENAAICDQDRLRARLAAHLGEAGFFLANLAHKMCLRTTPGALPPGVAGPLKSNLAQRTHRRSVICCSCAGCAQRTAVGNSRQRSCRLPPRE